MLADPGEGFATRLAAAIQAEGKSPSRTGREAGLQAGYIFKLLGAAKGKRIQSPGPEVIQKLADYLHVSFEWLAIGRGPMRVGAATPREDAALFALRHGISAEAVAAASRRYADEDISAVAWVAAFDAEERRLQQREVRRIHAEKERLLAEIAALDARAPSKPKRRAR